jgi:ABC-2 type transport system permease protein
MARKELLHVVRDPRSLGMGIAIPVLLLLLFGFALSLDVSHIPLAVWDMDGTEASRDLVRSFVESAAFDGEASCSSLPGVEAELQSGRAVAALVVPADFSSGLERGEHVQVQLIVDGSDANTARLATIYAEGIVSGAARQALVSLVSAYNPAMDTRWSIVPGLIAIIVNVIAAMLTSLCVAREWENGTMEQLVSTPVRKVEFLSGKLFPYYLIGVVDIAVAVAMAMLLFGVPLRGSLLALAGVSGVFLLGALSVGILVSTAAGSQLLASQLALVTTFLPGFLLSGFVYDINAMPVVVAAISRVVPARYFVSLLRAIFLKGHWGAALTADLLWLGLFTALVIAVTIRKLGMSLDGRR